MKKEIEELIPENIKELYTTAEELYKRNPKDYKALFNLTVIKLQFLDYNPFEIVKDLELLYKKLISKRDLISFYLLKVYTFINNPDKAIEYGEQCLDLAEFLLPEAYFSLAQNYLIKGKDYYENVIEYCNKALTLDLEDEISFQFQLLKLETYIEWNKEEEYNKLINEVYLVYGNRKELMYDKVHAAVVFSMNKLDKTESINEISSYLEDNPKDVIIALGLVAIYVEDKKFNEALNILKDFEDEESPEYFEIIKEKIRIYHEMQDYETIEKLGEYYLDKVKNKEHLNFVLFNIFASNFQNLDNLEKSVKYLKNILETDKTKETFNTLSLILIKLGKYQDLAEIALKYHKEHPEVGEAAYILAKFGYFVGLSYDECEKLLLIPFEQGVINDEVLIFDVLAVTKNVEAYKKMLKRVVNKKINKLTNDSKISIGSMYTTGLFIKQNFKKALKYLQIANSTIVKENNSLFQDADISCIHIARLKELDKKDYNEVFATYKNALEINSNDIAEKGLSAAFLAHCYINGLGVEKDMTKAKDLILGIMKENPYANGNAIYLYAYLYLIDEIDVNGNDVLKYLMNTYSFSRFDVSRYMLASQVAKKLGITIDFEFTLEDNLKYDSVLARKHYLEHKDDNVFYPFLS